MEEAVGLYLNPGPKRFRMAANSETFVDKTAMLSHLNSCVETDRRFACVSRPRRFGKTMAADMLCAYYGRGEDARGLFEGRTYYAAQKWYTEVVELDSGKGYADVAYLPSPRCPDKPALLIELKWNRDADTALAQIRDRRFHGRLEHYLDSLLLVGISYDRDECPGSEDYKRHSCRIERLGDS